MADTDEQIETQGELDPQASRQTQKRWCTEIELYEKKREPFNARAKKIVKRFTDERDSQDTSRKMNILWANIETLKPTIYAQTPKADVKRRFKDQDPVGRVASMIMERAVDYFLDCKDRFDETLRSCRQDYLLVAMAVKWNRYVPHMQTVTPDPIPVEPNIPEDGLQVDNELETGGLGYYDANGEYYEEAEEGDDGYFVQPEPYEEVEYEEIVDDYVHYLDFGHNAGARNWEEVYAVWRKAYLTREELHERFDSTIGAEAVNQIPLDAKPEEMEDNDGRTELFAKATVYEIWDKASKKAIWLHKDHAAGPLDERDDPLGLEEFFPCPKPLFGTLSGCDLIPVPDYAQYQDQAEEIDELTARIGHLTKALKVRGLYAGDIEEIKRLFQDSEELDLIPVENWAMYAEKGGLANAISWVPLKDIGETLIKLYEARERAKADLYEITGLSDILRGQSKAEETATAQAIKAQWGSTRVKDKQQDMARFARDDIRIKAEIISEHFAPETIMKIASVENLPAQDQQFIPAALELIKNDPIRNFRVEIETDSTIAADEQADKESRIEFLTAVTQFVQGWAEPLAMNPQLAPMAAEFLKFAIRGFKTGEALEAVVEQVMDSMLNQPQGQPSQPDPTEQLKAEAEGKRAEADVMVAQADVQKAGIDMQKANIEAQALPFKLVNPQQFDAAQNMTEGGL